MLKQWEKFRGWKILEYFLESPTSQIYINKLSRQLGVSPQTANTYLEMYANDGILKKKKAANASFYSLDNSLPRVKKLKQFYSLALLNEVKFVEKTLKENPETKSIILYGSHVTGEYDEKSDLDILIISPNKKKPMKAIRSLKKDVTLGVYSLAEWRKASKEFKESVAKNHVVLYGTGLVMK
ncbi:MAG: nucleotidyltransferase domain-containing protein [Candidatus Diapherotrites archaeon]|nr:nucleotidyltransferase domain-containing protein [Candidatus Diapherotrites archaeon]